MALSRDNAPRLIIQCVREIREERERETEREREFYYLKRNIKTADAAVQFSSDQISCPRNASAVSQVVGELDVFDDVHISYAIHFI